MNEYTKQLRLHCQNKNHTQHSYEVFFKYGFLFWALEGAVMKGPSLVQYKNVLHSVELIRDMKIPTYQPLIACNINLFKDLD